MCKFIYYCALTVCVLTVFQAVTGAGVERRRHRQNNNNRTQENAQTRALDFESYGKPNQLEYRLTRLEVLTQEKNEQIVSELRENTRRLQALEYQSSDTQTTLKDLKTQLTSVFQTPYYGTPQQQPSGSNDLELRLNDLVSGVKLVVSALRVLNNDIAALKQNISTLTNTTNILLQATDQLVSKQFFNKEMMDMKHQNNFNQHRGNEFCTSRSKDDESLPKTCEEVKDRGFKFSGIYRIQPEHSIKSFMVFCDLETMGGGWTVIQNRVEGSQDFYQNWHEYKHGFGNLGGEFWLGLENIHELTGYDVNELYIELEDFNQSKAFAHYGAFSVGSEVEGYPLKVLGGYTGDAGDSLIYHAGLRFSTKDMDQDSWPEGSCAQAHGGGWWYRSCDQSNLNGKYLSGELPDEYTYQGMYWGEFLGPKYSLKSTKMLIRPRDALSPPMLSSSTPKTN